MQVAPSITDQRPLAHLDLETVLVEGWLYNWRASPDEGGDIAVMLKTVKLFDYETGKTQLAPTIDHCWLWIAERYWRKTWELAIVTGTQMTLHDKAWLCCTVGPYRRSDGSSDWGLRPRNQFPVAPEQARKMRKGHTDLWRKVTRLRGKDLARAVVNQAIYKTELDHKAADWRELGRSYKDACTNTNRNLNSLQQQIDSPTSGITVAMLESLQSQGLMAIHQLHERLAEAER